MNDRIQVKNVEHAELTTSETVERMTRQFAQTGVYKESDLVRILGKPTDTVSVTLATGVVTSYRRPK